MLARAKDVLVSGFETWDPGFWFRVSGSEFWGLGVGFRVSGSWFGASGFRFGASAFGFGCSGTCMKELSSSVPSATLISIAVWGAAQQGFGVFSNCVRQRGFGFGFPGSGFRGVGFREPGANSDSSSDGQKIELKSVALASTGWILNVGRERYGN